MDDDDDYGADDALLEAMASAPVHPLRLQQPAPQRIQQPKPQRLDKAPLTNSTSSGPKVVQPTPQSLPQKTGSTILVSPRQRGNPILTCIRSVPWEYSDIPADYILGLTTCALFLSLKYHRLHPEYIYTRIQNLQGKYNLRIVLTMVDIPNHEDSLRELSKTSLVNNVTIVLCWSAAEAGRYLELYKSFENASFGTIKGQQASSYADKLVDFVTVPRSLNKSDAVALVANFGSLRNAVNADQEQLGMINGWGGVKVKRWAAAVEEPFRAKRAAKRGLQKQPSMGDNDVGQIPDRTSRLEQAIPLSRVPLREMSSVGASSTSRTTPDTSKQFQFMGDLDDEEDDAVVALAIEESKRTAQSEKTAGARQEKQQETRVQEQDDLSGGVAAALAKLREAGA